MESRAAVFILPAELPQIFEGLDEETKALVMRRPKIQFARAIAAINRRYVPGLTLSPAPGQMMEAWRQCPAANIRVVLLGQDPFIRAGEAMGLSFSVPRGKSIPPSTRKIYECLDNYGYFDDAEGNSRGLPTHGDLTSWAKQGVLMLNAALTTVLGQSNAHAEEWREYTDAIIRELGGAEGRPLVFLLFGAFAQGKAALIDGTVHSVITWGHPSPMNPANRDPTNEKNFLYCDAFTRANVVLESRGEPLIDWGSVHDTPVTPAPSATMAPIKVGGEGPDSHPLIGGETLWVFTDGGASANGKAECKAKWAYYITGSLKATASGPVADVHIPGKKYTTSNNRAELTAILEALRALAGGHPSEPVVRIVTDSRYCIDCITTWYAGWVAKGTTGERENIDLIEPAWRLWRELCATRRVEFRHTRGHRAPPADPASEAWLLWRGNSIVDELAGFR